tara:strand:- start:1984 stop:2376 length:393 start_codon:yes stop_codon:yes gene_type:complete
MEQQGIGSLSRGSDESILGRYLVRGGIPENKVAKTIQKAKDAGYEFHRIGNTIMSAKGIPPNGAEIYFYTAEPPARFNAVVQKFVVELKQYGIQIVYMKKVDPTILDALGASGIAIQQSDKPEYKVSGAL